ncbi:Calcium-channel protein CCH1 [Rhodotorula toruloides]|uniref:Calcium-channel protein CCH1 n=2 Tax=Rhodotorula toruloides TaxID=5286 RepID=A0A0K3CHL1_RHOTO|nr:Calcium-channel protein CCH1 [Rhodotorula toruloides]
MSVDDKQRQERPHQPSSSHQPHSTSPSTLLDGQSAQDGSPRTQRERQLSLEAPLAVTTAVDRPVSPSSPLHSPEDRGEQAFSSLRRGSLRLRRGSEGGSGSIATSSSAGTAGGAFSTADAAARTRTASEGGWISFRSDSPAPTTERGAPRRAGTVEMADGSVVRRLPSPPSRPAPAADDPFQASTEAGPSTGFFDGGYSVAGHAHGRSESQAYSLASETDYDPSFRHPLTHDIDEEELEARSPLQPSVSTPPTRTDNRLGPFSSSSGPSRRPYLSPLSTSPGLARTPSPRRPSLSGEGGWHELSASRSNGDSQGPGSSPGLMRRGTLAAAAERLRRASVRVVNLTGIDGEMLAEAEVEAEEAERAREEGRSPVDLTGRRRSSVGIGVTGVEDDGRSGESADRRDADAMKDSADPGGEWEKEVQRSEKAFRMLRGKTLGVFDPDNMFRQACARVLTARWTEPAILLLIILQVVVQTIQSSYNVYEYPRPTKGFFHSWEDYVLFVVFCAFTVEIVARIVVTGLVINPPRPPTPPEVKPDIYGTPHRSPSLVTKIQSRLSPMPSPTPSRRRSPLPSPSRLSPLPSPSRLSPLPPLPTKATYPPAALTSADITSLDYARFPALNTSAVALMREDAPAPPTIDPGPTGVGLGFTSAPSASLSDPFSIKSGLAAAFPAATAAAAANSHSVASSTTSHDPYGAYHQPSIFASAHTPYALSIERQRQTYQQAFLRHSWNRIDALAVLCFWISFGLASNGLEASKNLWFFRSLSVLRAARLLAISPGTQIILQSLKKASPLLVNVGLFVAFALLLFSIIGVQAFRGSYLRHCIWIDPQGVFANVTADQPCGGYIDAAGVTRTYFTLEGLPSGEPPKGFICGPPSICAETENPVNGRWSFDNILAALMQVTVTASSNTWTDGMYAMMSADYFASFLFYVAGVLVINYWMLNLFVAVITSTFGDIRDETKHSAFAATSALPVKVRFDDERKPRRGLSKSADLIAKVYRKTRFFWIALVVVSISLQASRSYKMDQAKSDAYDWVELGLTIAFDVEIAVRMFASLPDWRRFFDSPANRVDLFLAVTTSIIQLPGVFGTRAYVWLTCLQIARFYRVILAIPRMKRLLVRLVRTVYPLMNMILFLFLLTYLASLVAVEFFRGIPDPENDDTGNLTFYQFFNSFLAMYQILSSENWTDILKTVLANEKGALQIVLAGVFLCGWMFVGFFVIGNLFIAVLNEGFQLAEEEKRLRQLEAFAVGQKRAVTAGWFRRFDPYTYATMRQRRRTERQQASLSEDVLDRRMTTSPEPLESPPEDEKDLSPPTTAASSVRFVDQAKKAFKFRSGLDTLTKIVQPPPSPLEPPSRSIHHVREATIEERERLQEQTQRQRKDTVAEFIEEHPSYDRSLFLFSQNSRIRRLCQSVVDPAYGDERINGHPPKKGRRLAFQAVIFAAIAASIAIAGIATPLYRRDYFLQQGQVRIAWYSLVEVALGVVFLAEFLVRIIADGFIYSPNAYMLSLWRNIDGFVLLTVIVNVSTSLIEGPANNRFTRALKAFRALRLINLWPRMREAFYNVLILGIGRIIDASILAVLYIIPFAVWAQNIFSGLLYSCNDSSVTTKAECVGEYLASPTSDWTFLAPRVWSNPYVWSFDSFRSSLLILFEIISLEGWIDVMESVMQIKGPDLQPQDNASQFNALFFVIYNAIGASFILTVFVSVIIAAFVRRSGNSLLTTEQRQWQDLRQLMSRQRPAKRPKRRPDNAFRAWCYDRAVHKNGWWSRGVTVLYLVNIVVLMSQARTTDEAIIAYNFVFLGFTVAYLVDVCVRAGGLGRHFWKNGWNIYDVVVISGTVATTIPVLLGTGEAAYQLQKVFLVSLTVKLIQRSDSLNRLFKTAVASLPAIVSIFALWLVFFLVYVIFYNEIFGLTRWETKETHNANYYTFWSALVLLILQSTGEGWNAFMHDYTVDWPRCTYSPSYLLTDCGSPGWAYVLFITWNVLSMYLFVNLILAAVVDGFSFIWQDYGKVARITREDMRSFKKVWAEFDPERTGFIQPAVIPRFLHRLHGVFEIKIYRDAWSVPSLQAAAYRDPLDQHSSPAFHHYLGDRDALSLRRVDLDKLRQLVDGIDTGEVAARRRNYVRLYHEAMHDAEESLKGISLNKMLILLAHYRLVEDESALQLDELAKRRRKQELVADWVDLDRVNSFLRMVVLRRRFLAHLEAKRQNRFSNLPAINVTDEGHDEPERDDGRTPPSIETSRGRPSVSFAD